MVKVNKENKENIAKIIKRCNFTGIQELNDSSGDVHAEFFRIFEKTFVEHFKLKKDYTYIFEFDFSEDGEIMTCFFGYKDLMYLYLFGKFYELGKVNKFVEETRKLGSANFAHYEEEYKKLVTLKEILRR